MVIYGLLSSLLWEWVHYITLLDMVVGVCDYVSLGMPRTLG
jgi:hypothetical protein